MTRILIIIAVLIALAALAVPMLASACDLPGCFTSSYELVGTGGTPGDIYVASFSAATLSEGMTGAAGAAFVVSEPYIELHLARVAFSTTSIYQDASVHTGTSSGGDSYLLYSKHQVLLNTIEYIT